MKRGVSTPSSEVLQKRQNDVAEPVKKARSIRMIARSAPAQHADGRVSTSSHFQALPVGLARHHNCWSDRTQPANIKIRVLGRTCWTFSSPGVRITPSTSTRRIRKFGGQPVSHHRCTMSPNSPGASIVQCVSSVTQSTSPSWRPRQFRGSLFFDFTGRGPRT